MLKWQKKWSAPSIIDNVITYIPKLQNEVGELTLRKQKLVELERRGPSIRAISVLELGESGYEAVVQICLKKENEDEFSNLLHVMELQGFSILSASTSQVCREQRVVCYNFHVKVLCLLFIFFITLYFYVFIGSRQCVSK